MAGEYHEAKKKQRAFEGFWASLTPQNPAMTRFPSPASLLGTRFMKTVLLLICSITFMTIA